MVMGGDGVMECPDMLKQGGPMEFGTEFGTEVQSEIWYMTVIQISVPQTTATFCRLIHSHTLNKNARLLAHFLLFFFYSSAMCLFLEF